MKPKDIRMEKMIDIVVDFRFVILSGELLFNDNPCYTPEPFGSKDYNLVGHRNR